ncbi:MAG: hypothetical protein KGL56_08960 [Alphaproteobacteria bacterium]|nr:hypothetical protein [Alphaproteobacteria bacterium]MDE2500309.1 hypothetical protein [Alphaproteobacteria bacterium]
MNKSFKIALLLGAVTVFTGVALAQMEAPPPPDGPMQGLMRGQGRLADRLLRSFDNNHDGQISHSEMNNAIGTRFARATRGASTMTVEQFVALHSTAFRQHAGEMFKRVDWNGDGKVTLADYAAPQHARFMMMDRDGSGTISCAPSADVAYRPTANSKPSGRNGVRRGRMSASARSGFALARFCADNDLNKDGNVTRAEFDSAIAKRFSAAARGAATMTADQYVSDEALRFADRETRAFKRLDKNGDGRLTVVEFAANDLRLFARMDKNKDGIIEANELQPRFQARRDRGNRATPRYD